MPNGRSIVLERQQGADVGGYSGLEDDVDNHWGELAKAALLSTVLSVGSEVGSGADNGNNTAILQALRLGLQIRSIRRDSRWFGEISISSQP